MAIINKQFERLGQPAVIRAVPIPGVGVFRKGIVTGINPMYRQYGYADKDDVTRAALEAGEGDPSVVTPLVTFYYGTIPNCYKDRVEIKTETTSNGGILFYEIFWQPLG